ncbi:unnamed protein product [Moneuplotes crassus]|uniref:Uncharacterized protein n=2 Tax=Euplotes crassus TaxID=5936 RepID=A0AAD1Y8R5_EUPCR|nr:unnamed protein product [Moneuplotes crassus]
MDTSGNLSEKRMHRFHETRYGGDLSLLIMRVLFYWLPTMYTEYIAIYESTFLKRSYYFTQISLTLVTFLSTMAVVISLMKVCSIKVPNKALKVYQILYPLTFTSQLIVFVVYWTAIHPKIGDLMKKKSAEHQFFMYIVHIFPFLAAFAEMIIARPMFIFSEVKNMVIFGLFYTLNNFLQTKFIGGYLPYPFMTWKDSSSLVAAVVILIIGVIFYYIATKITDSINGHEEEDKKKVE